jgi:hypothetical protein
MVMRWIGAGLYRAGFRVRNLSNPATIDRPGKISLPFLQCGTSTADFPAASKNKGKW